MSKRGFTMVEMLVVIAIISILAALSIPQVADVLMKGRDARRKADLGSIQLAIESYYEDLGYYPEPPEGYNTWGYQHSTSGSQWMDPASPTAAKPIVSGYLRGGTVPQDPINNGAQAWVQGNYSYVYHGVFAGTGTPGNLNGKTKRASYDLTGQLENPLDRDRCAVRGYRYWVNDSWWCTNGGTWSGQIYEIGPMGLDTWP